MNGALSIVDLFDLLAIEEADRAGCARLLDDTADTADIADPPAVAEVRRALLDRLGSFSEAPFETTSTSPMVWLTAYLQVAPTVLNWHRARGIPRQVTRETFADVGRNLAIHRRAHGEFGLETWDWLTAHFTGMLFALGRLNFMLHPTQQFVEGVMEPGDWVPGIHIPESGRLTPQAVDDSLLLARGFFSTCFPDKPVTTAVCVSWLLDPYLLRNLPEEANIASFVRRFVPMGSPVDDATAGMFFVFRTRDRAMLAALPRDTRLQSLVLDRAARGEAWQIGSGYLRL